MTATNHALTGAMIATVLRQPFLAIPLALLSHFACDALPHFGVDMKFGSRTMYTWLVVDGLAAVSFGIFLLSFGVKNPFILFLSGFAAMSPDLAWLYYGKNGKLGQPKKYDKITKIHHYIQWYQKVPGIGVEFVWAMLMVVIIFRMQ